MADFVKLIQNENMKMFLRVRTYVMAGIMLGLVLLISLMWLSFGAGGASMWDVAFVEASILFFLVTIFSVVAGASTVAEEFSTGTIKLLLIRPWTRSKILLSKYLSVLLFSLSLAVLLFVSVLAVNWLCFGTGSVAIDDPFMIGQADPIGLSYMGEYFGLSFISTIVTVTLSFMLSTVFRSSALSIAMAMFLVLVVNNMKFLLLGLPYKWVDYVLFIHLNLTQYMNDIQIREGMTFGFSLSVLGAYYVLFIALAWFVFSKRDVSA